MMAVVDILNEQCPVVQTHLFAMMCGFAVDVALFALWFYPMTFVVKESYAQHTVRTRPILEYEDDIEDGGEESQTSVVVKPPTEESSDSAATEAEAAASEIEEFFAVKIPPRLKTTMSKQQLLQRSLLIATVRSATKYDGVDQIPNDISSLVADFLPFKDRLDHIPSPKKLKMSQLLAFMPAGILCLACIVQTFVDVLRLAEYINIHSESMVLYLCATRVVYESSNTRRILPIIFIWLSSGDKSFFVWDFWAHGPLLLATVVSFPVMVLHVPLLPVFVSSVAIGFPVWVSLFSVGLIISFSVLLFWEFMRYAGVIRAVKRALRRCSCVSSTSLKYFFSRVVWSIVVVSVPTLLFLLWVTYAVEMMVKFWGGANWERAVDFYLVFIDRTNNAYFSQEYNFRDLVAFWISFI